MIGDISKSSLICTDMHWRKWTYVVVMKGIFHWCQWAWFTLVSSVEKELHEDFKINLEVNFWNVNIKLLTYSRWKPWPIGIPPSPLSSLSSSPERLKLQCQCLSSKPRQNLWSTLIIFNISFDIIFQNTFEIIFEAIFPHHWYSLFIIYTHPGPHGRSSWPSFQFHPLRR